MRPPWLPLLILALPDAAAAHGSFAGPVAAQSPAPITLAAPGPRLTASPSSPATAKLTASHGADAPPATTARAPSVEAARYEPATVATPPPPAPPSVATIGPKGLTVQSDDGRFAFNFRLPIMLDTKLSFADEPRIADSAFLPRFFGPILSSTMYDVVNGKLIVGFADKNVNVLNAWIEVKADAWLRLRVGKFTYPIALERQLLALRIVFMEQGIASALLPLYELGAQLWGGPADKLLEYQLTVGNGLAPNQNQEGEVDQNKDVIGRVYARPFVRSGFTPLAGLGFGIGASWGVHEGSATSPLTGTVKTLGGRTFYAPRGSSSDPDATVVADGSVARLVPQASYVLGPLSIYSEYIRARERLRVGAMARRLTHESFHAVAALVLTGERAVLLDLVVPQQPFDLSAGHIGAVELIGRYESVRFDEQTFPAFADPTVSARAARALGTGLNWLPTELLRVSVNYEHTSFRSAAGARRLPSEDVLAMRLQACF